MDKVELLKRRLAGMCRILRTGDRHWLVKEGQELVRIPEIEAQVTTKRAIYSLFVEAIPEDVDIRTVCGVSRCACPDHLVPVHTRSKARALDLKGALELASMPLADAPQKPPPSVNAAKISKVKLMFKSGSKLAAIVQATGLSAQEVMRIRTGKYDKAFKKTLAGQTTANVEQKRESAKEVVSEDSGISKEEAEWLSQVGKG